jgi:peptidyl-prolyl cis-trans isomerase B (cyclophilin B)
LTACNKTEAGSGVGGSTQRNAVQSAEPQMAAPQNGDMVAAISTSEGTIYVRLFDAYAPQAVENFRLLAQAGSYNDTLFHRVVEEFVIQGGDTGNGGQSAWGTPFAVEACDALRHYAGALCMAAGPGGNGSQFYIVAAPQNSVVQQTQEQLAEAGVRSEVVYTYAQAGGTPHLDGTDTVFGQVYAGMDVVDTICSVRTNEEQRPATDIPILSVEVGVFPLAAPVAGSAGSAAQKACLSKTGPDGVRGYVPAHYAGGFVQNICICHFGIAANYFLGCAAIPVCRFGHCCLRHHFRHHRCCPHCVFRAGWYKPRLQACLGYAHSSFAFGRRAVLSFMGPSPGAPPPAAPFRAN